MDPGYVVTVFFDLHRREDTREERIRLPVFDSVVDAEEYRGSLQVRFQCRSEIFQDYRVRAFTTREEIDLTSAIYLGYLPCYANEAFLYFIEVD